MMQMIERSCKFQIKEYLLDEETTDFNRFALKSHLDNSKNGLAMTVAEVPSIFKGLVNKVFHISRTNCESS